MSDKMLHSHTRSAGFKGALSYRADKGIPGYTGYCPGSANIPLNIKGSTERTGKLCDTETQEQLRDATNSMHTTSRYRKDYTAEPASYNPNNKTGGGYWLLEQRLPKEAAISGVTTSAAELGNAGATADAQLSRSLGLTTLTAASEQARLGRAGTQRTTPLTTPSTSTGDILGYTTTSGSMVVKGGLIGGGAAAGVPRTRRGPPSPRPRQAPRANPPRHLDTSRSTIDYGSDGSDPMSHMAPRENLMTMCSTTSDLASGTQRTTWHIPSYTGFQCTTSHNKLAVHQSLAKDPRPDNKVPTALCCLQQYPRARLPGTTTFKPEDPSNMTAQQPSHGPPLDTTYGLSNALLSRYNAASSPSTRSAPSGDRGIMSFFSAGASESVSDNGLSNAQLYYKNVRPLEGLAKHALASKTTVAGGRFPPGAL